MTDKQINRKYCDGIDCGWCAEKEPCIYKIANRLEEQLQSKEQECEELKKARENRRCAWKSLEGSFCPEAQQQLDQLKAENEELKNTVYYLRREFKNIKWTNKAISKQCENLNCKDLQKLKQALKGIKEIAETQQSWNELNRQFSETESEDDIFAYNWSALKQILQKISEVENG